MPSLSQPTQLQRHPQPRPLANLEDFLLALQYVEDLGYKGQVQNLLAAGKLAKPC